MKATLKKGFTARAFTLIELLVVIAIIGILSSVVLASLNDARLKSRDAKRIADVKQLQLALELYFDSNSAYPATLGTPAAPVLAPQYIAAIPTDPLGGAAYEYRGLGTGAGATCTRYHLGANLEQSAHTVLSSDVDAAAGTSCTTTADFSGVDTAGTSCAGAASSGRTCYDLKP